MIDLLNHLSNLIPSAQTLAMLAPFAESLIRMIPSQKPLSILYFTADLLHALGDLSSKAGDALNHIVPQKLAAPAPAQA